jgi:hypothetical protein
MKIFILLISFATLNSWAMSRVPMTTGKLYIPEGFDTNDVVEVTVAGRLPDLCYRNPSYEVHREGNTFTISLFAYYVPTPEGCRALSLPYKETISLGVLSAGTYEVKLKRFRLTADSGRVRVKEASSSLQDEFMYGNVMGIREDEAGRGIELIGTNPVNCLKFEKLVASIQKSVIVLRPRFREEGVCKEHPTPFSIKYEVPYLKAHPKGMLLHVRVMDGRSYNYLYQNKQK